MLRIELSCTRFRFGSLVFLACLFAPALQAQGPSLTVTPGTTIQTISGISTLAPAAAAYDSSNNLYIADSRNHVILRRTAAGVVSDLAGTRRQGFSGDSGPAITADLDTPTALAFDTAGNLYIADSHNHRVRRLATNGTITTVAGNGSCSFSGDNGSATSASLCLPSALATDAAGNLYIADQRNHRIRRVDPSGRISTIAGNGEQAFSGDNGNALAAGLDSPSGIAVDVNGVIYLSDTHNQRIRRIDTSGVITTVAADSTSARLIRPTGIALAPTGDILIADSANHVVRALSAGSLTNAAGNGEEASSGDGSAPSVAGLRKPAAIAIDSSANLVIADAAASQIRQTTNASLNFALQKIGSASAAQSLVLTNNGTTTLSLRAPQLAGAFLQSNTCGSTLTPGSRCSVAITFTPVATGQADGRAVILADGLPSQTVTLSGVGYDSTTTTVLTSPATNVTAGSIVALTATLSASGPTLPTGNITFTDSGAALGQSNLNGTTAVFNASGLAVGSHSITAKYSGDALYDSSTSSPIIANVAALQDFTFASDSSSNASQTVTRGASATYRFSVQIPAGSVATPVVFSVSGLPNGATATFSPASTSTSGTVTLTIQTPVNLAWLPLLFFAGITLSKAGKKRVSCAVALLIASGLQGCGSSTKSLSRTYAITVNATATSAAGTTMQHATTLQLSIL